MKRLMGVLMLALLTVTGCSIFDFLVDTHVENAHITTSLYEGVIFTATNTEVAGMGYEFNDPIVEYWTPTGPQIETRESGLIDLLQAEITPDRYEYQILDDLAAYKRQYFGITFADGQHLIYTNFFCVDEFDYWLASPVFVMDGGECFFQVLYNPATQTFSDLRINGYA
ncbi:MAG: hypothetical protein K8L99_11520 [Anaerolineae bacterium]|nr:hypothetical protein [Anaerolineae bacterium]